MPRLTAAILTLNEADRIEDCLASVAFCDERLVLDAGSTDGTVARARACGARVMETDWPGFVVQKNRALAEASGDWVLAVDADERVDDALRAAIVAVMQGSTCDAYRVQRRNIWLGHTLSFGLAWPDRRIRLVRRGVARWVGRDPHDRLEASGPVGDLPGELVHDSYRSLGDHLARIERYTRLDARDGGWLDIVFRPPWHLFRALVLRQGLRDGLPGLIHASLGALYVLLKWSRRRFDPALRRPGDP